MRTLYFGTFSLHAVAPETYRVVLKQLSSQLLSLYFHLVVCIIYSGSYSRGYTFSGGSYVVGHTANSVVVTNNLVWDSNF